MLKDRELVKVEEWRSRVRDAEDAFLARWSWSALLAVDAKLQRLMKAQLGDFAEALVTASVEEVTAQGEASLRGFAACAKAMEASAAPPAFVIGSAHGRSLVIGDAEAHRAQAMKDAPNGAVFATADEIVAALVSSGAWDAIAAIKQAFPGARAV